MRGDIGRKRLHRPGFGSIWFCGIHRHHASSETVVILRGKIRWIFYDENGNETESVTLDANGEPRMLNVEKDRWHSLECLESGSVLYESKDGTYHPLKEDEVFSK